jgi:hypothetical protein
LYELPLSLHDEVALVATTGECPEGWLFVKHLTTGIQGLIPDSFVLEVGAETEAASEPAAEQPSTTAEAQDGKQAPEAAIVEAAPPKKKGTSTTNKRVAIHEFRPEAGAVYELPLEKGDIVELSLVDWAMPNGWVVAKDAHSDKLGLVPVVCLGMPPEDPNAPTLEELKEEAERSLKVTKEEKESAMTKLAERDSELEKERESAAKAKEAQSLKEKELEAMAEAREQLSEQVAELQGVKAMNTAFQEVIQKIPKVKEMVDAKMEEAVEKHAAGSEDGTQVDESEPVPDHEEELQKSILVTAEKERATVARRIQQLDEERLKAVSQLTEAVRSELSTPSAAHE